MVNGLDEIVNSALKAEVPSDLEKDAEELNLFVLPEIGSSETDLRAASLRDWFVELLWRCKTAETEPKSIAAIITASIELFNTLLASDSVTPVVQKLVELFSPGGMLETFPAFMEFFAKTLIQHQKLWKAVLTKERETSLITREINISNLDDECCSMSLNMALPDEYLRPPIEETSDPLSDCGSETDKAIETPFLTETVSDDSPTEGEFNTQEMIPIGASLSRVTKIYDRVTNSMMEEMKTELKTMIDKTETELKEKYIKTSSTA